jgi:hypothetical protein
LDAGVVAGAGTVETVEIGGEGETTPTHFQEGLIEKIFGKFFGVWHGGIVQSIFGVCLQKKMELESMEVEISVKGGL